MSSGETIAARAQALVGVRFRPQGRDPQAGLDCVGAAAAAAGVAEERIRRDYPMRGHDLAEIEQALCGLGCRLVPEAEVSRAGDVIVCEAGPAQFHLLVSTQSGFVHADAGLGRVVERPYPVPWRIASIWRLAAEDE